MYLSKGPCRVEKEKWEYPGAVRLGITLLPGGQMDGNSDKTASLHPTLPPLCPMLYCCLPVLPFCSSDETGLSKWAERNNTYFIREVGTTEDASIWPGREPYYIGTRSGCGHIGTLVRLRAVDWEQQ